MDSRANTEQDLATENLYIEADSNSTQLETQLCGYFEKFDVKSREEQQIGFNKMMDDLKEYITENQNMEEYFQEHDNFSDHFLNRTGFGLGQGAQMSGALDSAAISEIGDFINAR